MEEISFIFKHWRGLSECTKCVLLYCSSLYSRQQPMGVCYGRPSSAKHNQVVHQFCPAESISNQQVHVIRKRWNPELKLQFYGNDESIKTKLSSFSAANHAKLIPKADHAAKGAAYSIKVRIPAKQLSANSPHGSEGREEVLATLLIRKHGGRVGLERKACFNSWRPSLESISEEEAQTNNRNR